jgi:putative FmdB family regulatory protein
MPLYEYVCDDCRTRFEKLVRAWGEAVVCPKCASAAVEKQLSTFAFAGADGGFGASASGGCGCGRGGCGCGH